MEQSLSQEAWLSANADKSVTTEMLDQMVKDMRSKRDVYEAAKAKATELYKSFEESEGQLLEALTKAGKRKYHVDGVGLVYFIEKLVVTTPKTLEAKRAFYDYLREAYGETFLLDKQSISHQSLQKIYNDAYNEAKDNGSADTFSIPGLDAPTAKVSIGFRKERE